MAPQCGREARLVKNCVHRVENVASEHRVISRENELICRSCRPFALNIRKIESHIRTSMLEYYQSDIQRCAELSPERHSVGRYCHRIQKIEHRVALQGHPLWCCCILNFLSIGDEQILVRYIISECNKSYFMSLGIGVFSYIKSKGIDWFKYFYFLSTRFQS